MGIGPPAIPALLAADDRFQTRIVPLVEVAGEIVSSSRIRALVLAGEVEHAARLPGRPVPAARGGGPRRPQGTAPRFPTANIVPDEELVCPGHAIYAAYANGRCAAVSVGVRPTFGTGRAVLVETYLIDQNVDLYGRTLTIEFLKRLRGERRFDSAQALTEQMRRDIELARELCG